MCSYGYHGYYKKPVKFSIKSPAKLKQADAHIVYDPALLQKFIKGARSLDFNKRRCIYRGVINMDDGNDTSNNIHDLRFVFYREAGDYYYQLGSVEIIHQGNLNLYIQHDQHKVVLSNQSIVIKPPVNDLNLVENALRNENYLLKSTKTGSNETLTLINEHHISCKELSVTLDTASHQLRRFYTRTTDFGSPMDKGKGRVMDVRISEMDDHANLELFPSEKNIVLLKNGKWMLTDKYKDYELIKM